MVTGAAGLVGQNLIPRLKARGYTDIVALDKHRANTRILAGLHPDIRVVEADLSRPGGWEDTFDGAEAVVQLHAQIGGLDAAVFDANNVVATRLVLAAAAAAGVGERDVVLTRSPLAGCRRLLLDLPALHAVGAWNAVNGVAAAARARSGQGVERGDRQPEQRHGAAKRLVAERPQIGQAAAAAANDGDVDLGQSGEVA